MSDPDVVRQRTLIGWMFEPLTDEHRNRVKAYLIDGDPVHLAGTQYEAKRRQVVAELAPKKPLPAPADPLSADELRKLVPAAGDMPDVHVEMVDGREVQLLLVVKDDGSVMFKSKLTPEELLHLLHHVVEDVQDTIRRRDAGLS